MATNGTSGVSSTGLLNITGLASGIDTNAIVTSMMAAERAPRNQLDTQATVLKKQQSLLQDFQTRLRSLESASQDMRSLTLWAKRQTVDTSDPTKMLATSATGAGIGSYQVDVTQLAGSAQRTYSFTSPAAGGTITIDGHDVTVAAGASITDVVNAINSDDSASVYAAATDSGTLVLSSRATGDTGTGFIAVTDGTGALAEQTALAKQGKNALYTVDGVAGSSSSNTVTNGIAGVSLTLKALTTVSGPVTVTVNAPSIDTDAIKTKIKAFVDLYNSTVDAVRSALTEKPDTASSSSSSSSSDSTSTTTTDPTKGTLFGDEQLTSMLSAMRQAIYTPVAGLPDGMKSLSDLGISTGDASSVISQDSLDGKLVIDDAKLTNALTTNPDGVRNLLLGAGSTGGWATGFETLIHGYSTTDGLLDTRINGASDELKDLQSSMSDMDSRLALYEQSLRSKFTAMETALSQAQATSQWLSGQLGA